MKPLLSQQPVTSKGDRPSRELVEVIDGLVREMRSMQAKLDAIAAVTAPTGGATVDSQARTAISAIIAGAT